VHGSDGVILTLATDGDRPPTICVDKTYITFEVDDGVVYCKYDNQAVIVTTGPELAWAGGWEVKFFGGGVSEVPYLSSLLRTPFNLTNPLRPTRHFVFARFTPFQIVLVP
jgi:hypothetical protein